MIKKSLAAVPLILLLSFSMGKLWSQAGRSFVVESASFPQGGTIPKRYTCDADDVSPALTWANAPDRAQSFALIADDPDAPAGTWTHWIIWNIPPGKGLPEARPKTDTLDDGSRQGRNDFKRIGYSGPCPPPGKAHRYFFRLYALNAKLDLKAGASRSELEHAIEGRVVAQAEWTGKYGR